MPDIDYLIVGTGITGAVFAYEMTKRGKKCLLIDQRKHIAGNCYTETKDGIDIHVYGPHIFHTDKKEIWDYINQFTEFNAFINSPIAKVKDKIYSLPFNMNTFYQVFGETQPEKVKEIIAKEIEKENIDSPSNLEQQAISMVGRTIYELLIKGYTEKQWGLSCTELPPEIIKRLPLRFTYDNNYFKDKYQGIPVNGYTPIFEKLLKNQEVILGTDYKFVKEKIKAKKTVFTGMIDEYFDFCEGLLDYKTLEFIHQTKKTNNFQGNAVVNYPTWDVPYTRCVEHRHFNNKSEADITYITYEFSRDYKLGDIPYYPIGNKKNLDIYEKYKTLAQKEKDVIFLGRLAQYKYFDMDDATENVLDYLKTI